MLLQYSGETGGRRLQETPGALRGWERREMRRVGARALLRKERVVQIERRVSHMQR